MFCFGQCFGYVFYKCMSNPWPIFLCLYFPGWIKRYLDLPPALWIPVSTAVSQLSEFCTPSLTLQRVPSHLISMNPRQLEFSLPLSSGDNSLKIFFPTMKEVYWLSSRTPVTKALHTKSMATKLTGLVPVTFTTTSLNLKPKVKS